MFREARRDVRVVLNVTGPSSAIAMYPLLQPELPYRVARLTHP
jgi:hypothetical protein